MNMLLKKATVLCVCASFLSVSSLQVAQAAMIGTERAVQAQQHDDRVARVNALLSSAAVEQQLVAMGVDPADARMRVAALSDNELSLLEHKLDAMPAGGDSLLAIIGVVFVVLLVLELVGVIDIFKKT